jgi:hypothetical protein
MVTLQSSLHGSVEFFMDIRGVPKHGPIHVVSRKSVVTCRMRGAMHPQRTVKSAGRMNDGP